MHHLALSINGDSPSSAVDTRIHTPGRVLSPPGWAIQALLFHSAIDKRLVLAPFRHENLAMGSTVSVLTTKCSAYLVTTKKAAC